MLCLEHGREYTITADDSSTKSRHTGGLIPPQGTSKIGPGHGCFNSTPHSRGSATHKHQGYGSNGHKHNYRPGCGTLHNECCGTN